ncbi:MAG: MerR family transcriptional regulator [Burkholderiales bacterium]
MSSFTISELSKEFGVTLRALRFYEDQGLLNPRRQGKNRLYSKRDRVRLRLTLRGRRLGLTVGEIRELFDLYDTAQDERAQLKEFLAILETRRSQLEQKREDIDAMLSEIIAFEKQCQTLLESRTT